MTHFKRLNVSIPGHSYPIYIGADILTQVDLSPHIHGSQVMVVTNETVAPLYLSTLLNRLSAYQVTQIILPDGEKYKTLSTLDRIFSALLDAKFDRHCTLIALGGGVIGDMTGFAAACYQRGVKFIQIPTTLLAQVDSSIGGKTAVNHALGKNMIGAFHQPNMVLSDVNTLITLADREIRAGLAEIIKIALIADAKFFEWLEISISKLLAKDQDFLIEAILRACALKTKIVVADEKETGQRALLNLGHTFGHAIEVNLHYQDWLHGEAVAAGLVAASALSMRLGWIKAASHQRIIALLEATQLPIAAPHTLNPEQLLAAMQLDKKVIAQQLRLILLKDIGEAIISTEFSITDVEEIVAAWCGSCNN